MAISCLSVRLFVCRQRVLMAAWAYHVGPHRVVWIDTSARVNCVVVIRPFLILNANCLLQVVIVRRRARKPVLFQLPVTITLIETESRVLECRQLPCQFPTRWSPDLLLFRPWQFGLCISPYATHLYGCN